MEEKKERVIELRPLSKWKRLLVFLGDYFVAFILSFILFNLAVFPLAKIICDTQTHSERAAYLEQQALNMLKDDGYLYAPSAAASFEDRVNYTYKVFLSYYIYDDVKENGLGHKDENEVVRMYYRNVIKDESLYIKDFKEVNTDNMFIIDDSALSIALKDEYKTTLRNELEEKEEENYSITMTNVRDHVFARLFYLHVYNHITEHDYVKGDKSFNSYLKESAEIMKTLQWVATGSVVVAVLLSWGIVYVIYPIANKEKRTVTMSALRLSKLNYKMLSPITNKDIMIQSFYHFILSMSSMLFMPILYFGMAYSFNLPLLFILSVISLGLAIVSGIFIITNEYNRSGCDILTNTVLVPTSEIDDMYRERLEDGNREETNRE